MILLLPKIESEAPGIIPLDRETQELCGTSLSKVQNLLENHTEGPLEIQKNFIDFFKNAGFEIREALPYVGVDQSVVFTNSAINSLKTQIYQSNSIPSYAIVQPCIRVQNLKTLSTEPIKYASSFTMLGAFVSAEKYPQFVETVTQYFSQVLHFEAGELFFVTHHQNISLNEPWQKKPNITIKFDEHAPPEQYDWKFGEASMSGKGIDISVRDIHIGKLTDIGNIMEIVLNGKIIGYGLGVGVETMLSKRLKLAHPLEVMLGEIGINTPEAWKIHLFDTLILLVDFYTLQLGDFGRSQSSEVNRALKKLEKMIHDHEISINTLQYYLSEIIKTRATKTSEVLDIIISDMLRLVNGGRSKKQFSLVVGLDTTNDQVLDFLKENFQDISCSFEYDYINPDILLGKKSITLSIDYFYRKQQTEKGAFKTILNRLIKAGIIIR